MERGHRLIPCEDAHVLDDSTRRQLRFSLFLQGFALLMLGGALLVRASALGWDAVTWLLAAGTAVVVAALVFTITRLRVGE